jgi:L-threonylcarbamoyladenylate synthase
MQILRASEYAWSQALAHVKRGDLIAFPTDTVYGVGCDPFNRAAIEAIYTAKGRERQKAIPLLMSGPEMLSAAARWMPAAAKTLAFRFWPGALTLVVPRGDGLPYELGGGDTIAVRVPDHAELRQFIAACGGLIAATSANLSGEPDAVSAQQAADYLGNHVAVVINGGETAGNVPSTVVDCTSDPPRILRAGALDPALLKQALGDM